MLHIFSEADQCVQDRQSRFLHARETALHVIARSLRGRQHDCLPGWTTRNIVQRGPSCEEEPALPVLLTHARPLKKVAAQLFSEKR
jgi:hypothetical protein